MLKVCKNCFSDKELIGFINSQAIMGNCDFCKSQNVESLKIEELLDFFTELLDNFRAKENGQTLKSKIQSNWNLFSSLDTADKILNHVIDKIETEIPNADAMVEFSQEILDNVNYWDKLKYRLMWESRYFTDVTYLVEELGWDGFFQSQIELTKGTNLYRARLHHTSTEDSYIQEQMFCPPKDKAT